MRVKIKDEILSSVEKPARYTGNEWNMVVKDETSVDVRFAFCFPDVYEIGMSHLGMKILYHMLNNRDDCYCERVFAPWNDMEMKMRENGIPAFSLETHSEISDFDILGFTIQYEMVYTNILNILDLSGIPMLSADRKEGMPFVCAGGPCVYNPEPISDFIDFFVIGEAEEVLPEIIEEYKIWKMAGLLRKQFLYKIATIQGVYVPGFYTAEYNNDGTLKGMTPENTKIPKSIKKRFIKNLDNAYYPTKIIVPYISIVHDRIMLEIFRGCIRGCRFCQAGFIYRPVRERSSENLLQMAGKLVASTGYEEVSLTSLSTSDYSQLEEFTESLVKEMQPLKVNFSLPSIRIDAFPRALMEQAHKVRKGGLTFAPEAGTQRLRDVINKGITEEDLEKSVKMAFEGGWRSLKFYFMLGLPSETYEDVEGISNLVRKTIEIYHSMKIGRELSINLSAGSFVPKPFTPFQWVAQDKVEDLNQKSAYLREKLKNRIVKYSYSDNMTSLLEAVFARGDRHIGKVILLAWKKGCKFDAWSEYFKISKWLEAFDECAVDPDFYANREREYEEILPWDHIDIGVTKQFLIKEAKKAKEGVTTSNCKEKCAGCGISSINGVGNCWISSIEGVDNCGMA